MLKPLPTTKSMRAPDSDLKLVLCVDKKGVIRYANEASQRMLRLWQKEVGQVLPDFWLNVVECAFAGDEVQQTEVECERRTYLMSAIPMPVLGFVNLYGEEITEKNELSKLYDKFLSTISHELRTPLTLIMGFVETLLAEKPGPLTVTQKHFLQNSYKSARRLLVMVEELLTVTHIQKGTLTLERESFSPEEAILSIRARIKPQAGERDLIFEINNFWNPKSDGVLIGDQAKLEWVMAHLVENALKFTPGGGRISATSQRRGDYWHFEVVDTGIGIPEADKPHLFDRFYRGCNAAAKEIQGTGLGLDVCKTIIEMHNGQIGFESELDAGTRIWVVLPIVN